MKRNRLYTVGAFAVLMLILSACQVSIDRPRAPVRNFTFESSWQLQGTNAPISCENLETYFRYSFYAENPARIESITEHYEGARTGEVLDPVTVPAGSWQVQGNRVTVTAVFDADGHFLPLSAQDSLETQAIIIRPDPDDPDDPMRNSGATDFEVAVEYDGGRGTYNFGPVRVQAYAGCQPLN